MQLLIFILVYPIIWLLSKLPMRVLYLLSDGFFTVFYYIIGYRKKVVFANIKLAFPEKSNKEVKTLSEKFFKHLCDLIFESIKAFSISEKEILKHYKYKNPEILDKIAEQGRSIALVGSHQANWEWSIGIPLFTKINCFGAYNKLGNSYFDKVVKDSRQKFGFFGYKTSDTIKGMINNTTNGKQGLYLLLSDQSPQVSKTFYWSEFLGIKVPIHTGAEMLSKKFNLVVVNYSTKKIKRGLYETEFTLITETPKDFDNYQITDTYLKLTEKAILAQPEFYLWSHKRFKHRNKVPEAFQ
jgi:KDO2-lipid IV(A) lauroyltransferase